MRQALFLDLETSGLSSDYNQILEIGIVEVKDGVVNYDNMFHCYIDHPRITYSFSTLKKFGDRIKDRKPDVRVLSEDSASNSLKTFMRKHSAPNTAILGGKNVGIFDSRFLDKWIGAEVMRGYIKHRIIDIGNLYGHPKDSCPPSLGECLVRARWFGINGRFINQLVGHTALEDAFQCAELYAGWWNGLVPHHSTWSP